MLHWTRPLAAAPVSDLDQASVVAVHGRGRVAFVGAGVRANNVSVVTRARLAAAVFGLERLPVTVCFPLERASESRLRWNDIHNTKSDDVQKHTFHTQYHILLSSLLTTTYTTPTNNMRHITKQSFLLSAPVNYVTKISLHPRAQHAVAVATVPDERNARKTVLRSPISTRARRAGGQVQLKQTRMTSH